MCRSKKFSRSGLLIITFSTFTNIGRDWKQRLNEKQAAEAKKDKTIAEQADTIELLKGCIMELADVVYGDGGEVTA